MTTPPALPSPHLLRLALGLIFFHFGFVKFFPDLSPAELIASQTVMRLTGGSFDASTSMWWLALFECLIGVGFLLNIGLRFVSVLFVFHMVGTFMPLLVLPEITFKMGVLAPTLEGQYILKNIVFVAAGWTILLPHCLPSNWLSGGNETQGHTPLGQSAETGRVSATSSDLEFSHND